MKVLSDPHGHKITYSGLGPEAGPLPAFLYFSLSAEESLTLHPYNSPAVFLEEAPLRTFSFDIPGHGEGFDKFHAMQYWADQMAADAYFFEPFFERVLASLAWLIEEEWIDPEHIATGGLSRGGFIATHIAARETRIKTVIGFAPLTRLCDLKEFQATLPESRRAEELNLSHCVDHLTHLHNFRFYMGNRDQRVNTDACYHFIRHFAETVHAKRARHCQIELRIIPSIGHKGHGTSPQTFEEGSLWVKSHLLGR